MVHTAEKSQVLVLWVWVRPKDLTLIIIENMEAMV